MVLSCNKFDIEGKMETPPPQCNAALRTPLSTATERAARELVGHLDEQGADRPRPSGTHAKPAAAPTKV